MNMNVSKTNGVKLLAAIMVMAMVFAGVAVIASDSDVSADYAPTPEGMQISGDTITLTQDVVLNDLYRLPANIKTVDGGENKYSIIDNTTIDHCLDTQYSTNAVTFQNIVFVANYNAVGSIVNTISEGGKDVTFQNCEFQTNEVRKAVQVPGGVTATTFQNCEFNGSEVVYNAGAATAVLTFTNCSNLSLSIATNSSSGYTEEIVIGTTGDPNADIIIDDATNSTLKNLINGWNFGNGWAAPANEGPQVTVNRVLSPESILAGSDTKAMNYPAGKITEGTGGSVTADETEVPVYDSKGQEKTDIPYELYYNTWEDVQTALTAGEEVTIDYAMPALDQNITVDNNAILNIVGVTITSGVDSYGNQYTITVEDDGTLNTDAAYIYVGVDLNENAQYSASNTHVLTSDGQLNSSTQVGFGDTLTLTGTVPETATVSVYGSLITSDLTVNGSIVSYIGSDISADGSITVSGSFVMNDSDMELAGTITIRNDRVGNASFVMNGESTMTVLENGVFNVNRATSNGAQPNYLTVADTATFTVEGALNITRTLNGAIQDKGTITFNGAAGTNAEIVVYNGVTLDITSVSGTMTVCDNQDVIADYGGLDETEMASAKYSVGNTVTLTNVRGVSVSIAVSDATYDPISGTQRVRAYISDMTVTGTVSKVTTAPSGSIMIDGAAAAITGIKSDDTVIGTMTVDDLSLGRNLAVTFDGTVTVAGTLNANVSESSRDGGITITNSADSLTVTGTMIVGEGVTESLVNSNLNAVFYSVTSTGEGTAVTDYYTNFANAITAIADADDDRVLVYGDVTVDASAEIANGMTVQVQTGGKLTIGSDVTLTVADGGVLDVSAGNSTNKAVDVNGVLVITNNATGLVGSANAIDYDVLKSVGNTDTYSSLAYALSIAQPGETITLSTVVTLDSDTTIPEGVTVSVPRNTGLTLEKDVTLTVNGTLAVQGGNVNKTAEDTEIIVNGVMSMTGSGAEDTLAGYGISGAYFTLRNVGYVTNVDYASQNVDDGVITIKGQISFGDVTFTERNNGDLQVIVENLNATTEGATVVSAGTITLVGAQLSIQTGTVTATVAAAANGSTATIDLDNVLAETADSNLYLNIESTTVSGVDGDVDVLYIARTVNSGTVTIASGTVTVGTTVGSDTDSLFTNSDVSDEKTGAVIVAEGAVLDVPEGAKITARANTDADVAVFTVNGTLDVDGTVEFIGASVIAGTLNANDGADVDVNGSLTVTGTVAVTEAENESANFDVNNGAVLIVGIKPTTLGADGAVTGGITISGTGYLKAYPGADLSAAKINWQDAQNRSTAVSTVFNINDTVYMTIYAASNSAVSIQTVLNAEEFELVGYDVGLKGMTGEQAGLYQDTNWYTSADMLANQKVADDSNIGTEANAAIYSAVEASYIKGTISEGTGLDLYIDNIKYSASAFPNGLQVGTHTVSFEVTAGYDGSNATITFNGQTVANGGTITIEAGATGFTLVANGAVPGYSYGDSGSDGMGLTEILLIILVVLIVIMAIMVALRLMRS